MSDAIKLAIEALEEVSAKLRLTGATLPAPEPKGTVESAMTNGICVALAVVEDSLAALRAQPVPEVGFGNIAQPADPFKKLSDAQVLWLAESHGIDVYASNPLAFYNDLISTTPAQPDHSEPFATMSITDDTGVIFSGLPSETVFKPGEKFHLSRVNSLEGKTK